MNTRASTYDEVKRSYTKNITDNQEREDKTQKDNLHLMKTWSQGIPLPQGKVNILCLSAILQHDRFPAVHAV